MACNVLSSLNEVLHCEETAVNQTILYINVQTINLRSDCMCASFSRSVLVLKLIINFINLSTF